MTIRADMPPIIRHYPSANGDGLGDIPLEPGAPVADAATLTLVATSATPELDISKPLWIAYIAKYKLPNTHDPRPKLPVYI